MHVGLGCDGLVQESCVILFFLNQKLRDFDIRVSVAQQLGVLTVVCGFFSCARPAWDRRWISACPGRTTQVSDGWRRGFSDVRLHHS